MTVMILTALTSASPAYSRLNDGDTVVFFGDSITRQGEEADGYLTLFRQALTTKRPDAGIKVIGAGIGGHKVPDLEERLDRDVLAHHPNVVVIYIGINDVWHSIRDQGTEVGRYESGLRSLVKRIRATNARVILATPSVIGEKKDGENELDAMLTDYSNVSRRVAEEEGVDLLDLRQAFLVHLAEYNVANIEKGVLTTDGVHLSDAGNRFVAARMLEATGIVPSKNRVLRHHVYFKFREGLPETDLDEINRAFHALQYRIPTIVEFERGTNNSPEGLARGFTHAYIVTFSNEEDRDAYLPHPAHKEFGQLLQGKLEEAFVFDFWATE